MNWLSRFKVFFMLFFFGVSSPASFPNTHKRFISSHQIFNIWNSKFALKSLKSQELESGNCRSVNEINFRLIGGVGNGVDQKSVQDPGSVFITWYYKCMSSISKLFIDELEAAGNWKKIFDKSRAPYFRQKSEGKKAFKKFLMNSDWSSLSESHRNELITSSVFYLLGPQYINRPIYSRLKKHLSDKYKSRKVKVVLVEMLIFISLQEEFLTY